MKTLQSNFTTPEQSKRLLEMGVPAWTADCYYARGFNTHTQKWNYDSFPTIIVEGMLEMDSTDIPCWSVGRLIEIMNICSIWGNVSIHRTDREVTQIEQLIEILQNRINGKTIDLSKLEE